MQHTLWRLTTVDYTRNLPKSSLPRSTNKHQANSTMSLIEMLVQLADLKLIFKKAFQVKRLFVTQRQVDKACLAKIGTLSTNVSQTQRQSACERWNEQNPKLIHWRAESKYERSLKNSYEVDCSITWWHDKNELV